MNEDNDESHKQVLLFEGLFIFPGGVGPNRLKVGQLLQIPPSTKKKAMQSVFGLVSYLRDYIALLSHLSGHLHPGKHTRFLTRTNTGKSGLNC